jgi:hypothetical protein
MHESVRVQTPRLSVVLATDGYETIRPVIAALGRQHAQHTIEPVIVLPSSAAASIRAEELTPFAGAQIVPIDARFHLASARAAGVRAATAPVVFIGETHTYPQPGWAESLLAAFGDGFAAVVPAIDNANPNGPLSWAAYLFDYGRWGSSRAPGEMRDPLMYNTAYRRSILLALDGDLSRMLDPSEEWMWTQLHAAGHRAIFAPAARILHLNVGHARAFLVEKFCAGAALGMRRAARWPWHRRLFYIIASPLIPVVLLARVLPAARRVGLARLPAATVPALVVAAVAKAAGELAGYLGIQAPALDACLQEIEVNKVRYAGRAR